MGLRYRLRTKVFGSPDIVFVSAKVAVFVDGCQWHCCPDHWVRPKSNVEFWDRKFDRNRARDAEVNALLRKQGWRILRFWEHQVERSCELVAVAYREFLDLLLDESCACASADAKLPADVVILTEPIRVVELWISEDIVGAKIEG